MKPALVLCWLGEEKKMKSINAIGNGGCTIGPCWFGLKIREFWEDNVLNLIYTSIGKSSQDKVTGCILGMYKIVSFLFLFERWVTCWHRLSTEEKVQWGELNADFWFIWSAFCFTFHFLLMLNFFFPVYFLFPHFVFHSLIICCCTVSRKLFKWGQSFRYTAGLMWKESRSAFHCWLVLPPMHGAFLPWPIFLYRMATSGVKLGNFKQIGWK